MPTYSYECGGCGYVFDVFHGISAEPKIKCEECGKKCRRLMGTGAGIIFKGSGFYETDFKEKKGKAPEKSSDNRSESKSESKSEKKTGGTNGATGSTKKKAANN